MKDLQPSLIEDTDSFRRKIQQPCGMMQFK